MDSELRFYTPSEFMGEPVEYWVELHNRCQELDYKSLIQEIFILKKQIAYYEKNLFKWE